MSVISSGRKEQWFPGVLDAECKDVLCYVLESSQVCTWIVTHWAGPSCWAVLTPWTPPQLPDPCCWASPALGGFLPIMVDFCLLERGPGGERSSWSSLPASGNPRGICQYVTLQDRVRPLWWFHLWSWCHVCLSWSYFSLGFDFRVLVMWWGCAIKLVNCWRHTKSGRGVHLN